MITGSAQLTNTLEQGLSLYAKSQVIAEWNYNRFLTPTASNFSGYAAAAQEDEEVYPISSIVGTMRPRSGIAKARVGEAKVYSTSSNRNSANYSKYVVASKDSSYKYWTHNNVSAPTITSGSYALSGVDPFVIYDRAAPANKVSLKFEVSWAAPVSYTVYTTVDGTTWVLAYTGTSVPVDGRVDIWRGSGGVWSTTPNYSNETNLKGVRLNILAMNKPNAHANVIELSLRRELDISADVISVSIQKTSSDEDIAVPIGKVTANSCSISLDNTTNKYNNDNSGSTYAGMIKQNVSFSVAYGISTTQFGGAGLEYMPQGTFYADNWSGQQDFTATATCTDRVKFFQTETLQDILLVKKTAWEAVTLILDSIGFRDYSVVLGTSESDYVIKYLWFEKGTSAWDAIKEICTAAQAICFMDEYNKLIYKSREALFENTTNVKVLDAIKVGSKYADIISTEVEYITTANKVTVEYNEVETKKVRDVEQTALLWEQNETLVLRNGYITADISSSETTRMFINSNVSEFMPYKGYVNIEGEIIGYSGKVYSYRQGGVLKTVVLNSQSDKDKYDGLSDQTTRFQNHCTGELRNLTRAEMGSTKVAHNINISGWSSYYVRGATATQNDTYMRQTASTLQLTGPSAPGRPLTDFYLAVRGASTDAFTYYGTRILFSDTAFMNGTAGLFMHLQSDNLRAYFFEISLSDKTSSLGHAEVRAYRRNADGTVGYMPSANASNGWGRVITKKQWYIMEVRYIASSKQFSVYLNGTLVGSFTDPLASPYTMGKWGVFVTGNTVANFDFFYGATGTSIESRNPDDSRFYDRISGGYESGFLEKEIIYYPKDAYAKKNKIALFFDDFGPLFHEVKVFDVRFSKTPALASNLLMTNISNADALEYRGTAYSGHFILSNKARGALNDPIESVIIGEDARISKEGTVRQSLIIFGPSPELSDSKEIEVKDLASIRQNGPVELQFQSPWIQEAASAQALADWIVKYWGLGAETLSVKAFIDPRLQIGDLVGINYPAKSMAPSTHKYHVVGISLDWDNGITGNLTLRRAMV